MGRDAVEFFRVVGVVLMSVAILVAVVAVIQAVSSA